MPLGPHDIPEIEVHRLCVRCRKWHWPHEGRDYVIPRVRPAAVEIGRALVGREDPIRFLCDRCHRKRLWLYAGIILLAIAVLIWRYVVGV